MSRPSEDPMDALETLGNETRIEILRALAEAEEPLAFTELRTRVGIRDTGKFNYHLTELCEYFVRETTDGYDLGPAGSRLIATAGEVDPELEATGPADGASTCPVCGEADCDKLFHVHLTPPWRSDS